MAGPIIVEGPDGQEYEFPEGTAPDVMKQAMRKRYATSAAPSAPAQPASPFLQRAAGMLPAGTQPVFPAGAPATGKQAALDARNARITAAQRVQRTVREQTATERDLRVKPVEEAAARAGKLAKDAASDDIMANPGSYALGGGFRFNLGRQAEQEVYDEAGVVPVDTAYAQRGVNSTLWGVPGIVSKEARARLAQAGEDQPGAALAGDVTGIAAGGAATWVPARAGVNALVRPLIPQGADAASRGVRYISPLAGQTGGVMLQNAGTQAGVFEPIRAEQSGEDLTIGGMAAAAKRGLTDPLNALPAVASGINRTWNALTSGIATPSARAAQMANQFGVGPRQTAASQGIAQTTRQLGGQIQPGDIAGFANIENMLRFALRDNRNIPDVNARIATGFERIRQSLPLADDPTLNLARLIEREFSEDAPQTRDIIRRFLLKVGLDSPGGGQIVGDAANAIRGQQTDVLRTEVESAFGAQPRVEADAAIRGSLDQFSQAYNTVLRGAPTTGPQVDRARALLAREPQSMAILDDVAQSRNMTPEQLIERAPLEALHLVQSELASQARAMAARGDAGAGPLEITVRNMQRPLREGVQGYGELQGLWRQWTQARERMGYVRGAEAGTAGELGTVPGFGDKVLGAGGVRNSEMGTQTAADVFLQMDELSQRAAGLSVRDVISDELRKMRAAGVDQRYAAPARMAQVATEGGLDALRRVFGEVGDRVARRIEQFIDATEFSRNIDPEFNSATMNKGQAMQTGAQPFAGPLGQGAQAADSALSQGMLADAALLMTGAPPILSIMRAPGFFARSLQPSQRTQQNIASTLLRRGEIGSQVPPLPGGPPPIMPINPAMVPGARPPPAGALPPQVPPGSAPAPAPRRVGLGTRAADATAVAAIASGGQTAQADTGDAQGRIDELTQSQTAAQQLITEYEQGLKAFEALSPLEKQRFLKDNGFKGEDGKVLTLDGGTGDNTTFAINNYKAEIEQATAAAKAERELFRKQINDVRVSLAEQDEKPSNPWVDKGLEIGTYAAAIYAAHRVRGMAVKGSEKAARGVEANANALLTRLPVPPETPRKTLLSRVPIVGDKQKARIKKETTAANKAQFATEERLAGRNVPPISSNPTSENGLPVRTANLGEFDRRRAAGDFGPAGPVSRFMEPVTSRIRPGDASLMAAGATDAYVMEGMLEKTRADISAEEKRLDEARKANDGAGDPIRIQVSRDRLKELRNIETTFTVLQRVGVGLAIGGAIATTHGRYAKPQPRFEAAERERDLINRAMAPPPPPANALAPTAPAPRQPRTPPAPKSKPPVAFTTARPRRPSNDND